MNYHILNGDALRQQFPSGIGGTKIIARECFVDGAVSGDSPETIFQTRSRFLGIAYPNTTPDKYEQKVIQEFEKMKGIPDGSTVYLWFEDDLFCQVNLWFVLYYLDYVHVEAKLHLVRPNTKLQFGFGGMSHDALVQAYDQSTELSQDHSLLFKQLWSHYQSGELDQLLEVGKSLSIAFPFITEAVQAHVQRIPKGTDPGRPKQVLLDIMKESDTTHFSTIFKLFKEREAIYGFGDLQVKQLLDEILDDQDTVTPKSFS